MLFGYLAGAYAAAAAPGFYLNHYCQLVLPPLVIGAAWSISPIKEWAARREIRLSISRWWFLAMVLIIIEGPFFRLSAQEWSRQKFGGGEFIVTQRVAARILQELRPGEQFYNWGWETGLYFYTQTRPPAGVLFSNVLQGGPLAESLTRRTLNQLHDHPPKLVVFAKWIDTGSLWQHPISRWILENYRTIPTDKQQEPFLFMVRQDPNNKPRKS